MGYDYGEAKLRIMQEEPRFPRGDSGGYLLHELVEACGCCNDDSCEGEPVWKRGMVRIVQDYPPLDDEKKGRYTVEYDDGSVSQDIHFDHIRPLVIYTRGDVVEVKK